MAGTPSKGEFVQFFSDVWRLLTGKGSKRSDGSEVDHLGRARRFIAGIPRRQIFSAASSAARAAAKVFGRTLAGFGSGIGSDQHAYQDAVWIAVGSSWIKALRYQPMKYKAVRALPDEYSQSMQDYLNGGQGPRSVKSSGFIPMPASGVIEKQGYKRNPDRDIGDLDMWVKKESKVNPSGRYTYPRVPRWVMDDWMAAGSKGQYYHHGDIRIYSDRRAIFQRFRISKHRPGWSTSRGATS